MIDPQYCLESSFSITYPNLSFYTKRVDEVHATYVELSFIHLNRKLFGYSNFLVWICHL